MLPARPCPFHWASPAVGRNNVFGRQSKVCGKTISAIGADEVTEGLRAEAARFGANLLCLPGKGTVSSGMRPRLAFRYTVEAILCYNSELYDPITCFNKRTCVKNRCLLFTQAPPLEKCKAFFKAGDGMNPTQQPLTLEEIYAPVETAVQKIPDAITRILATSNDLSQEVIDYFFSGRGKLLRPALVLLGNQLKNGDTDAVGDDRLLKLAASYEIFHAATLIHDDIIDSAYLRRNIPTINVKWGAQTAVLVGDFLHDKALTHVFTCGGENIFKKFLETASVVCDGEIHELKEKFNFAMNEQDYLEIIRKKTAVLLAACVEAGALYGGADEKESKALYEFGLNFGLAFQIVDDCLDFMGNEHEFGKTLGADCTAGVLTLPLIRMFEILDDEEKDKIAALFRSGENPDKFKVILQKIREQNTIDYSLDKARAYSDKARSALNVFSDSPVKQSLEKLVDYVLERNR